MKISIRLIAAILFSFCPVFLFGQSAKKYFSSGEKFEELKNYKDAISSYTKAIEMDPKFEKAYLSRANCYELVNDKEAAIKDYETSITFSPKDEVMYYKAGKLYYELGNYSGAKKLLDKSIALNESYLEALQTMVNLLHKTNMFIDALRYAEKALDLKKSAINHYNYSVTLDSLKNYADAEKGYKQAKYFDYKFVPAYVALVYVQLKQNKTEEALKVCDDAIVNRNFTDISLYEARAAVYAVKNDYQNAINDITKTIMADLNNTGPFMKRAKYYEKLGQFQNAVNDYSKILIVDTKNISAYYGRANCYEQIGDFKNAVKDYDRVAVLSPNSEQAANLLKEVKKKMFEFNREVYKPEITIISHKADEKNVMKINGNSDDIELKGIIKDASKIKSVIVNAGTAQYGQDTLNPEFSIKLNIKNNRDITVEATDVYDNKQKIVYTIERTETNPPSIALLAPYASDNNEIYLDNNNQELYLEGKIKDESLIASINVEGYSASFDQSQPNPGFNTKISIANKLKFTITVKDIFSNETVQEYKLNREGANMNQDNPMGTTWVVFIENSAYQNYPALAGPPKDIMLMKSVLVNYKVNKIIHKKNMAKADMEKFLSIELRDLILTNNVKTLFVWYSGHGKLITPPGGTGVGYWIPVDAKQGDESSFCKIANFKSDFQSYQDRVTHILLVTDACEAGPSFMYAYRGAVSSCDQEETTRYKTAQAVSSAGFELASDNSKFAKTFSGALNNNKNSCISINEIFEEIERGFGKENPQKPQFGAITPPVEHDKRSTFYFIKK